MLVNQTRSILLPLLLICLPLDSALSAIYLYQTPHERNASKQNLFERIPFQATFPIGNHAQLFEGEQSTASLRSSLRYLGAENFYQRDFPDGFPNGLSNLRQLDLDVRNGDQAFMADSLDITIASLRSLNILWSGSTGTRIKITAPLEQLSIRLGSSSRILSLNLVRL